MFANCAITTDWVVYLVCRSFSHSEKLCMGPDPPKLTQGVNIATYPFTRAYNYDWSE